MKKIIKVGKLVFLLLLVFMFSGCIDFDEIDFDFDNPFADDDEEVVELINGFTTTDTIGAEVKIGSEEFYVISYDSSTVTLLAKTNLVVGTIYDDYEGAVRIDFDFLNLPYGEYALNYGKYGLQSNGMNGWEEGSYYRKGVVAFSSSNYWSNGNEWIYNSSSNTKEYVDKYESYLEEKYNISINESRLIKYEELVNLGCDYSNRTCTTAPNFVYSTSYWTGTSSSATEIYNVLSDGRFHSDVNSNIRSFGVRPVIVLSKALF